MPGSRTTLPHALTILLTAPLSCNPDPPDGQVTDPHGCRTIILPAPFCGDGVLDDDLGEECDDGPQNADDAPCTSDCNKASCGDGHLQAGEECDDGPQNADNAPCTSDCKTYTCGDGLVLAGIEQCDDGDGNAADASCTPDCLLNECGDGYHHTGVEECDDGPQNADNAPCTSDCKAAACGDGHLQAGEECDHGPFNADGGFCTASCKTATCGDGLPLGGIEECDDGDDNSPDAACTPACEHTTCGDGIINTPGGVLEECDDGNTLPGDGCSPTCTIEFYTVFVTSSYFTGNLGGLSSADAQCQSLAASAGHAGTFRAWLSAGSDKPANRFGLPADFPGHFVLPDGTVIARGFADLLDGALEAPLNVFENGQPALGSNAVWTGTDEYGNPTSIDCSGWKSSSNSYYGRRGQMSSKIGTWTSYDDTPCNSSGRLYCLQVSP